MFLLTERIVTKLNLQYYLIIIFIIVTIRSHSQNFNFPTVNFTQPTGDILIDFDPFLQAINPTDTYTAYFGDISLNTQYVDIRFIDTNNGNYVYLSNIYGVGPLYSSGLIIQNPFNPTLVPMVQIIQHAQGNSIYDLEIAPSGNMTGTIHNLYYTGLPNTETVKLVVHTAAIAALPTHSYQVSLTSAGVANHNSVRNHYNIPMFGGTFTQVPETNTIAVIGVSFVALMRMRKAA